MLEQSAQDHGRDRTRHSLSPLAKREVGHEDVCTQCGGLIASSIWITGVPAGVEGQGVYVAGLGLVGSRGHRGVAGRSPGAGGGVTGS